MMKDLLLQKGGVDQDKVFKKTVKIEEGLSLNFEAHIVQVDDDDESVSRMKKIENHLKTCYDAGKNNEDDAVETAINKDERLNDEAKEQKLFEKEVEEFIDHLVECLNKENESLDIQEQI